MQVAAALDGRRALAFVFLVAALLRLLNVWQLHDAPVFDMRLGDTAGFPPLIGSLSRIGLRV